MAVAEAAEHKPNGKSTFTGIYSVGKAFRTAKPNVSLCLCWGELQVLVSRVWIDWG